jgi:predicted amidophosphoribosyltransferase
MQTPAWFRPGDTAPRQRQMGQRVVCRSRDSQAVRAVCVEGFAPSAPRCRRCGLRVGSAVAMCGACLADPPPFDACSVARDYVFPRDRRIADSKFNGPLELAAPLARRLIEAIRRDTAALPQGVLRVPMTPQRLAERGHNQAWELARRVANGLGCRFDAQLLDRPLAAAHQAELGRAQRPKNLRGAFVPNPSGACHCTASMSPWSST